MKKYFVQVSCLQPQNKMQEKMIAVVQPYQHYLINGSEALEIFLGYIETKINEISIEHAKLKAIKICKGEYSLRLERDYNAFVSMSITQIRGEY